jgi:hypothetical protein
VHQKKSVQIESHILQVHQTNHQMSCTSLFRFLSFVSLIV